MSSKGLCSVVDAPDFGVVIALAEQTPVEALPELVGRLAHAQAIATLRLGTLSVKSTKRIEENPLLTVEEVAARLRISEANVYARARTDLRSVAVEIGPGQLRFEAAALTRFVEARRRQVKR